ncbi:MAG: CoA pyrophosphatase [Actinomycetes bacterium]
MTIEPTASPFPGHEFPQRLPHVDRREPGGPPPWKSRNPREWSSLTAEQIALRLRHHVFDTARNGDVVNDEVGAFQLDGGETIRQSAVLLCLFDSEEGVQIVLTRRAAHLKHHRHEVAFPGGRCEQLETPTQTAVREAKEEVGIASEALTTIGHLTPIVTMASNSSIYPVVAIHAGTPAFSIDPNEVERVFSVPLSHLFREGSFAEERWWRDSRRPASPDGSFPIYFFKVPGDLVWGATARILAEFLEIISRESKKSSSPL